MSNAELARHTYLTLTTLAREARRARAQGLTARERDLRMEASLVARTARAAGIDPADGR